MGKLWDRLKKNPALLALGIALVAVIIYVVMKSQNQTGNPQGGASSGSAGYDPQTGLPYGQSSSQGGYYLLSEEDVPGPINVTVGAGASPTAKPGPPGPRGPRGMPGPRGIPGAPGVVRGPASHRKIGTNPNVRVPKGEQQDNWFPNTLRKQHVTHLVSPIPLGVHSVPQHNARPITSSGHITFKGNQAGQQQPKPIMGLRSGVRAPGIRTH